MTIQEIFKKSVGLLKSENINNAELDAEILICFYLKKDKAWLYSNLLHKLSGAEQASINKAIIQRMNNIPISYITKNKEFYKLNFHINKNVLIPRPETEMIVNEVIKITQKNKNKTNIVDIGVGSGAIIVSIAKNIKKKNVGFLGIDISKKALYVSRKNAAMHQVDKKINFIYGKTLNPLLKKYRLKKLNNSSLIITANLPYLTSKQVKNEKSIQYEPKIALISGKDGLNDYRLFFNQLKQLASKIKNEKTTIIIEFDPSQTKKLLKIIKLNLPKAVVKTKKDLCGLDRIMIITI